MKLTRQRVAASHHADLVTHHITSCHVASTLRYYSAPSSIGTHSTVSLTSSIHSGLSLSLSLIHEYQSSN